jgi:hypothetical protein
MTTLTETTHGTKWIPVKNLSVVWAAAQRELNQRRVDKMAAEFDPDLFDELVVTLPNGDGIYHVVDGQHRKTMIHQLFGENEQVPCRVVKAQDPARAASIFEKINTGRKTPTPLERFKVRVTAGSEVETEISKLVQWLGYKIERTAQPGCIGCVSTLIAIHKGFGHNVLRDTLVTIKGTWADDAGALEAPVIEGFAKVIARHSGHLDWKRLREKTASTFTPGRLIGHGKNDRETFGGTIADGIKRVLVRNYNHGLKTGKLEA